MINKIKLITKTNLVKTSFFTSIATIVKIITLFILNKVVAVLIGPSGVAVVGQFNNFLGIITSLSNGGITNGTIKYLAQDSNQTLFTKKVISTSFIIIVVCSTISAITITIFSSYFSQLLFKTYSYQYIIIATAISLLFTSLNSLLLSILVGFKDVKKYSYSNITSSLLILVFSLVLVNKYNIDGVLIALILSQSFAFFITLILVIKSNWFKIESFYKYFDITVLKKLSTFSVMTIITSFTAPISLLIIRNYIGNNFSWDEAGNWQGIWTISEVYLMFVTSVLGVYYLPRLSEINNNKDLRQEILNTSKIVLPIVSLIAIFIFVLKDYIVLVLFTDKFNMMLPLFKFQLIGDVFKIACWLISYQMIAKSMIKLLLFSEVFFNITFVLLSIYFSKTIGIEGIALAFCVNYFIYLIFLFIFFRKLLFAKFR